jgi:hypothetical protein
MGKRIAKTGTIWPKEATFDSVLCGEMEVMIKNYKHKKKRKEGPSEKGKR